MMVSDNISGYPVKKDCLSCSASFSDDVDGKMVLRCAEHDWKIVPDDGYCEDYN